MDLNEFQTRLQKIDVLLKEQGWIVGDRSKVIEEVDTKKSDFKAQDYKTVEETFKNRVGSKYVDYLLLDKNGKPLAIIEAKRTSKDPLLAAQTQAEQYADDIKEQTGEDVFIFLSNGYETWFWDREQSGPRLVKGFFAQRDLERIRIQQKRKISLTYSDIDTKIVDRSKSIEVSKRVLEHLDQGHRKALIVMATGTGKTRVALAIVKSLLKAKWCQKVLFLADRIALRDQAYNAGFKQFIPNEKKDKILSGNYNRNCRLYVSTIQTFQEIYNKKDKNGKYYISPSEFDVIISDEAHRSIYNKWKDVFTYLDGIQIGLTATPADFIERDTFRFFNCLNKMPTALYTYEEAVNDGILCDFRKHILEAQTNFQIEGITIDDLSESEVVRLLGEGKDPFEIDFEGTDLEKKVAVKGTSEAIVKEFMETCLTDESGTLPAKTIFFAISKKHAKRLWEAFEKLYPQYKGKLAKVIVSEDSRAQDSIEAFKRENMPRVAISVDMLDTGIDVPEICNLVLAKPVLSKIKFWQMLGRGTRSDNTCKHKDWLPNKKKEYFKVYDFWKNFEYFKLKPEGAPQTTGLAITVNIFFTRLKQMEYFASKSTDKTEVIRKKIIKDIELLPEDSVSIREKKRNIEKTKTDEFWKKKIKDQINFLKKEIAPLMKYKQNINYNIASFTYSCEKLGLAILQEDIDALAIERADIEDKLLRLPNSLRQVREKSELIEKVLKKQFWEKITFEDSQMLIKELAHLMRHMRKEPREPIILDLDDMIKARKTIQFGPDANEEYIETYKGKVEKKIQKLAKKLKALKKIEKDEPLTILDLKELEEALNSPDLYITEEVLRKIYEQNSGTLIQFIMNVLGLYSFPEPEERIKDAFQTFIIENNKHYTADKLNFIRTIQTIFLKKKNIEYVELFEAPFTNFGTTAPMPMFSQTELNAFIAICKNIKSDIFR